MTTKYSNCYHVIYNDIETLGRPSINITIIRDRLALFRIYFLFVYFFLYLYEWFWSSRMANKRSLYEKCSYKGKARPAAVPQHIRMHSIYVVPRSLFVRPDACKHLISNSSSHGLALRQVQRDSTASRAHRVSSCHLTAHLTICGSLWCADLGCQ